MTKKASYLPRGQRVMNAIFSTFVRLGLIPGAHLLSVRGRKSGVMRTTPVFVLKHDEHQWLVAGFAQSDWVKNLRAAGSCVLIHDRRQETVTVVEIKEQEVCAPLIQAFVRIAPGGKMLGINPDAPLAEFVAQASEHPVFRIEKPASVV
jgi:deazaflavin-dependent oxidoreductase (nitroreductase family)